MALRIGIIGLPNAGKSTLLNALAGTSVPVAPYPFTTIQPNVGVVPVPDDRLEAIAVVTHPQRVVPATVEFIDVAGLVRGASRGEGLGNQFLAQIREVDALAHVVRLFDLPAAGDAPGGRDPRADAEIVETELALADLATLERVRERVGSRARTGDREAQADGVLAERLVAGLERGVPARRIEMEPRERERAAGWRLLTAAPVMYIANVSAGVEAADPAVEALAAHAAQQDAALVVVDAQFEAELGSLSADEAHEFRAGRDPSLTILVRAAYSLLGLVTFFTILSAEVRAWPVARGTDAVTAAGRIHTDMARGFIRAEVIDWQTLVADGGMAQARERGHVRLEGKTYQVQDGDVVTFRFAI